MFDWIRGHLAGVVATTGEVNAMEPEFGLSLQELEGGGELSKLVGFDVVGHIISFLNDPRGAFHTPGSGSGGLP